METRSRTRRFELGDGPDRSHSGGPSWVVRLAGEKLDRCRTRVQQAACGHRGRNGDPLNRIRRILHTRTALLTDKQKALLFMSLNSRDEHVMAEITHHIYLEVITAYEHQRRRQCKKLMWKILKQIQKGVPAGLEELAQLGRTLWARRAEILAYFDTGVSNGPVEAINGRLEHLRGIAQGFRNLNHYILRSLLHSAFLGDRQMLVLHRPGGPVRWSEPAIRGEVLGPGEAGAVAESSADGCRGDWPGPRHRQQQLVGAVEGIAVEDADPVARGAAQLVRLNWNIWDCTKHLQLLLQTEMDITFKWEFPQFNTSGARD